MKAREELRVRIENDVRAALSKFTYFNARYGSARSEISIAITRLLRKYRESVGVNVDRFRVRLLADVSKGQNGRFTVRVYESAVKRKSDGAIIIEWPFRITSKTDECRFCKGNGVWFDENGLQNSCGWCDATGIRK